MRKLIGYAESFGAIAQSLYGGDKLIKDKDMPSRQSVYYHTRLENNRHLLADNLREMAGVMKQVAGEVLPTGRFRCGGNTVLCRCLRQRASP